MGGEMAADRNTGSSESLSKPSAKHRPFDWHEEHPAARFEQEVDLEFAQQLSVEATKRLLVSRMASVWEEDRKYGFFSIQQSAESRSLRAQLAASLVSPQDVQISMGDHVLTDDSQTLADAGVESGAILNVVVDRMMVDENVHSIFAST